MQIAQATGRPEEPVTFLSPDAADRTRLSGPGLRTFRAIADRWGLSESQRLAALGHPPRSTYHAWMQKAERDSRLTLPYDTLLRISAVLGIHKALTILFHDDSQALVWLKGPHRGSVFANTAPLSFLLDGGQDGMMTVRRYLDAWRGGSVGAGAKEGSFEPVREDDVVFL